MQITYNNVIIDVKKGTKVIELLKEEIRKSEEEIIACRFNNEVKSLNYKIEKDGKIELIDLKQKDGMRIYKRGLIYVIGKAFKEVCKEALITVNYQLYDSMFCDVSNIELSDEIIEKVNKRAEKIIKADLPIIRKTMTKEQAREFYKSEKTLKGILQLDLKQKPNVTLYYCEDYYNYFYGVMPVSTGYMPVFEIKRYEGGFLIRYPSRKNPKELTKFKETKKLFKTLEEYEEVHKVLNVNTLYKLNKIVEEHKIKEYILLDEALHEKKIASIADTIAKNKNIKLVTIAGPSSSGKTTFAQRLAIELRLNGLKPITISVDNYFVERKETPLDEKRKLRF